MLSAIPVWGLEIWELGFCHTHRDVCALPVELSLGQCPQEPPRAHLNPWKQLDARDPLAVPCPSDTHQLCHRGPDPASPRASFRARSSLGPRQVGKRSRGVGDPCMDGRGAFSSAQLSGLPSLLPFLRWDFSGDLVGGRVDLGDVSPGDMSPAGQMDTRGCHKLHHKVFGARLPPVLLRHLYWTALQKI